MTGARAHQPFTGALAQALDAALGRFAADIAARDAAGEHRYADLDVRAAAIAAGLVGLAPHEPVIVQVANRAADLAAFLGVWRAGGVVVPAHRAMPEAVRADLLATTGARFAVDGSVRAVADAPPPTRPLLDGAAFVIFTSGSTGRPKGVVLGHDEFAGKLAAIDGWLGLDRTTRMLLVLQITFSFGIWNALLTLLRGGLLVLEEKFEPAATAAALRDHAITVTALVPTMLRALASRYDGPLAPSVRRILTGGEPLNTGLAAPVATMFPGAELLDIYGLTETSTCDLLLDSTGLYSTGATRPGLGQPTAGVACRIADATGADVAEGTVGELLLRTRFAMRGYLDDPAQTAAARHGDWLRTGDLARRDADGRIRLAGRAKDLISRGANKISPLEIEQAMQRHPDVAAALATGVPDALMGERIHVLVLPRPGAALDEAALRAWAADHLERFKRPDTIHIGSALPVGRTGKADRGQLRALIERGDF
ncbi:MAG: acyl--CoA ligase [Alphaproteobacteria bacterium]|nr:acyl--CoA ligase [Alphaproteobacteria bacterium]